MSKGKRYCHAGGGCNVNACGRTFQGNARNVDKLLDLHARQVHGGGTVTQSTTLHISAGVDMSQSPPGQVNASCLSSTVEKGVLCIPDIQAEAIGSRLDVEEVIGLPQFR